MSAYLDAHDPVVAVAVQPSLEAALGIALTIDGAERLPNAGAIIVHNLRSPLDPFVIALAISRSTDLEPVVIVPAPLEDDPLLSGLLNEGSLVADVAVSRGAVDLTRASDLVKHMVDEGRPVLLASGQRRVEAGRLGQEAALLGEAGRLGADVVPAATYGTHRRYDGTSMRSHPERVATTVAFGSPVTMDRRVDDATATSMLHADIEHLLTEALATYPEQLVAPVPATVPADPDAAGVAGPDDADLGASGLAGEVWAGVRADSTVLVDPEKMPQLPDLQAAEELLPEPPPHRPAATAGRGGRVDSGPDEDEVAGVLSFHFPGRPLQSIRRATLETDDEGRLAIVTRRATVVLTDIASLEHHGRTVHVGDLADEYVIQSGGVRMTIPPKTRVAFLEVRRHDDSDLDQA